MNKLWAGRAEGKTDKSADKFNSSIAVDSRMYKQDIKGSMAHAAMLGAKGIVPAQTVEKIINGLAGILDDMENGRLMPDPDAEDIHMFVEAVLTERIGDAGKALHTARSRNDQVALDVRLYLRDENEIVISQIKELLEVLAKRAQENAETIMPGYTHMQRAQPITFGQHLMAYAMMLMRDIGRIEDAVARMNYSPLGCCALAGTTYPTDRGMVASALGFDGVMKNSLDGVSDRDFCAELLSAYSILMMHLSRFSEELILWSSWEFSFVELDDGYSTGSSIMPQKKNPDMAELVRGKTGRVYGDLVTMLTMQKGLPLAYNKDMQEDKEAIFDALDTVKMCLGIFIPMLDTMKIKAENMKKAAQKGFINATDIADYLVRAGLPFREAYKITGTIIKYCIKNDTIPEELPLETFKEFSPLFADDVYEEIKLEACVKKRASEGGTAPVRVIEQIQFVKEYLNGSV